MDAIAHLEENCKWERPDSYAGHSPDGCYMVYTRNRDSSILENTNYTGILEALMKTRTNEDRDRNYVYDFCAGHWACGWVEYIIVHTDASEQVRQLAGEMYCALNEYPILDDSAYSEACSIAIADHWESMELWERVGVCKECGVSIFAARNDYPNEDIYYWLSEYEGNY